ncbi:hypothetical protein ES703_124608 [subsurface metagenome]
MDFLLLSRLAVEGIVEADSTTLQTFLRLIDKAEVVSDAIRKDGIALSHRTAKHISRADIIQV